MVKTTRTAKKSRKQKKAALPYYQVMAFIVLFSVLWHLWSAPVWQLKKVHLHDLSQYSQSLVQSYIQGLNLEGRHILKVNPLVLKEHLLGFELVKGIDIRRSLFPGVLHIYVQERKAAFLVYPNSEKPNPEEAKVVDDEGVVLRIPASEVPENSVRFTLSKRSLDQQISGEQVELMHYINQLFLKEEIAVQGFFNIEKTGEIILNTPAVPVPVWLGTRDNLPVKLSLIAPAMELAKKQSRPLRYIDLRYWKHPVLKTR